MNTRSKETPWLIILAIITFVFYVLFIQQYLRKTRALADQVDVTISPSNSTMAPGQEQTLSVVVNSGDTSKKISGFDLVFTSDNNTTFTDVLAPNALSTSVELSATQLIKDVQPHRIRISYAFLNANAYLDSAISLQIKMKGNAAGTGTVDIDTTNSSVVGNIAATTYGFGVCTHGTYTYSGQQTTGGITVRFDPIQSSNVVGTPFNIKMIIDGQSSGNRVSGFDINLQVNTAIMDIVSVSDPIDAATGGDGTKFTKLMKDVNAQTGAIRLNYVSALGDAELPVNPSVILQLKGKSKASGTVHIGSAQVVGNIPSNAYTVQTMDGTYSFVNAGDPTATPIPATPTPTIPVGEPTATPTIVRGSISLNMKLKFQGIIKQPVAQYNTLKVQVIAGKTGYRSQPAYATFTADANGIWSGTVNLIDVSAGSGYSLYIKGPKHLSKRICDSNPSENSPATYRCVNGALTLQGGTNTIDFSNVYLLSGDLPEQDSAQNGIVDAYDLSFVRLNLGSRDLKVLSIADLNLDGIIDSQDYSLVIASLNVKYDEL
jgi:hypothetical protein